MATYIGPILAIVLLLAIAATGAQTPASSEDPPKKQGGVPFGGLVADGPPQCPRGQTATLWGYVENGAVWGTVYQCV